MANEVIHASSLCAHKSRAPASVRCSPALLTVLRCARLRRKSLIDATFGSVNVVSFHRKSPSVSSPVTFGTFCLNCQLQVGTGRSTFALSCASEIARSSCAKVTIKSFKRPWAAEALTCKRSRCWFSCARRRLQAIQAGLGRGLGPPSRIRSGSFCSCSKIARSQSARAWSAAVAAASSCGR